MLNITRIKKLITQQLKDIKMGLEKSSQIHDKEEKSLKDHPSYVKWLTQGLIFSVAINFALITSMVFNVVKSKDKIGRKHTSVSSVAQANGAANLEQTLIQFSEKNFQSLIDTLSNETHVEDGFTQRDLALSILAHQFDLDVDRALMGQAVVMRYIPVQGAVKSTYEYPVFSGLSNSQYHLIQNFVENERWPLTSQGLYKRLLQNPNDESLRNAFYLCKEFMYVDGLFCSLAIPKDVLLNIILKAPWDTTERFIQENQLVQNFSTSTRIQFLSQYLCHGSQYAAQLILELDATYAIKKLDDSQIVALMGLMDKKTNLAENFAIHLALGNRSDWVRKEACRLLYHYADMQMPRPFEYTGAVQFIAQKYQVDPSQILSVASTSSSGTEKVTAMSDPRKTYVVQDGDTLWKIAKKNQVTLDELKEANCLESDLIKVGMQLKIP